MKTAIRKFTLCLFIAGAACNVPLANSAYADSSCAISEAAGKPAAPPPSSGSPDQFRIFWQISTQIEDLADAAENSAAMKDIAETRKLADGYYINTLLAGPLIYWPNRPLECALNKKVAAGTDPIDLDGTIFTPSGGTATRDECGKKQDDFIKRTNKYKSARELQTDALQRVIGILDFEKEQASGKPIWGAQIVSADAFRYDRDTDKVSLKELPRTYCFMNSTGITLNGMLLYMEQRGQTKKGKFLWIPVRDRNGKLESLDNARLAKIPENSHAFDLIARSFAEAGVPASGFRANIRQWNAKKSPRMVKELVAVPGFGGFNFEGGTAILPSNKNRIDNYVAGISWILQNTDSNVSLLMAGFWDRDMVGSTEEIDQLIPRVRELVLALNAKLSQKMGSPSGENAICSNRINLIVASYGQPVHVKALPVRRDNGNLAGTVTGQIKLLSDVRKELCSG